MYFPLLLEDRYLDVHPDHLCSTKKSVPICCIDERGRLNISILIFFIQMLLKVWSTIFHFIAVIVNLLL